MHFINIIFYSLLSYSLWLTRKPRRSQAALLPPFPRVLLLLFALLVGCSPPLGRRL